MTNNGFDEAANEHLTELAYAMAEKRILEAALVCVERAMKGTDQVVQAGDLFDDLDLKHLIDVCFEEALEATFGDSE